MTMSDSSPDRPSVDLSLMLLQAARKALQEREREVEAARERVDELMRAARDSGATTIQIANAARASRTTVHKALSHRGHRVRRTKQGL